MGHWSTSSSRQGNRVVLILYALLFLGLLGALVWAIWVVPQYQVHSLKQQADALKRLLVPSGKGSASTKQPPNFKERLELEKAKFDAEKARTDAENAARTALVQGLGGFLLFVTAGSTLLGLRETQKTRKLAQKKQDTESFAKAVEWIVPNQSTSYNIGGIHYLGQLAKSDPDNLWPAIDVLIAYIRGGCEERKEQLEKILTKDEYIERARVFSKNSTPYSSAISILKQLLDKRNFGFEYFTGGIELPDNILIRRFNLSLTSLGYARLDDVLLVEADFSQACLSLADLSGSILYQARLRTCNLRGTILQEANLREVDFSESNLQDCDLTEAELHGADLTKVVKDSLTQGQINRAYGDATTKLPPHLKMPDHWVTKKPAKSPPKSPQSSNPSSN